MRWWQSGSVLPSRSMHLPVPFGEWRVRNLDERALRMHGIESSERGEALLWSRPCLSNDIAVHATGGKHTALACVSA